MTTKEQLIEQHIREYESRIKHIDELYERAHQAAAESEEAQPELQEIAAQRKLLRETTDEIKAMTPERWREETVQKAGPMAVWDILAQKLEDFVERHE